MGDFSSPELLGLHLQRLIERLNQCRGWRRRRRSLSKRVPWSAETRGTEQSARRLALTLTWLLVF